MISNQQNTVGGISSMAKSVPVAVTVQLPYSRPSDMDASLKTVSSTPSVFDFEPAELDSHLQSLKWPKFRARQLRQWVYEKLRLNPDDMSNFSRADRQKLPQILDLRPAEITKQQESDDG